MNLLPLIKRSKSGEKIKIEDKNQRMSFEKVQRKIDELEIQYGNLEEMTNQAIVHNGMLVHDNKLLIMEVLKAK